MTALPDQVDEIAHFIDAERLRQRCSKLIGRDVARRWPAATFYDVEAAMRRCRTHLVTPSWNPVTWIWVMVQQR